MMILCGGQVLRNSPFVFSHYGGICLFADPCLIEYTEIYARSYAAAGIFASIGLIQCRGPPPTHEFQLEISWIGGTIMCSCSLRDSDERDELRARFTSWLDVVVYRAKLKYLKKKDGEIETVSLDSLAEYQLPMTNSPLEINESKDAFDFEEERLAAAFAQLPLKRQQILTMLFVQDRKPEEIARLLNCSQQHVYDQRYQALKKLRLALTEEGDDR